MKTRKKTKSKAVPKPARKQQSKKIIVAAIAVSAAGILGYFGWQYWKKKKSGSTQTDIDEALKTATASASTNISEPYIPPKPSASSGRKTGNSSTASTAFPLKKGSKGEKVKHLQQALIDKYGVAALPKYGADGDFGSETANALKKAGLPATINESTFNVLVQGTTGATSDGSSLGKELYKAVAAKNFNNSLAVLKRMNSPEDYSSANEVFKADRIGGVHQTIVNGLLNTFAKADQKEKIRFEFLRMGLQYDGQKWLLSGLDGIPIMTVIPSTVWINPVKGVQVPAKMFLGKEICKRLDYTLFQNNGKHFLIQSKCVKPLRDY